MYVLASAPSPASLHPRLIDLLTLGRLIVPLPSPSCLPASARVSILRSALGRLQWPLRCRKLGLGQGQGQGQGDDDQQQQQQQQRQNESALEKATEGYRPADLWALAGQVVAARVAARRQHSFNPSHCHQHCCVSHVLETCLNFTPPSEGSTLSPTQSQDNSRSWSDIGGYSDVKSTLFSTLRRPLLLRKLYVRNKIKFPRGVLLFGPPGCGKTALARAAGAELGLAVLSVRGPELLNKYIGESERAVRSLFEKVLHTVCNCVLRSATALALESCGERWN